MALSEYISSLYGKELDGYVHIMSLDRQGKPQVYNALPEDLGCLIDDHRGRQDTFITPNSFYIPKRANGNIRQYRALFIDVDLKEYSKSEAYYQITILANEGKIPKPSLVIDSGRGLHLYWIIEHAPKQAAFTWQELEDYLYKHLKYLGADIQATDAARLLRLPGTINSRNNQECKVLEANSNRYSMYDLRTEYLNYVKKDKQPLERHTGPRKYKDNLELNKFFNSYNLHITRARDLETLARLRGYNVTGHRNSFLHCYIYWKGIYNRELESLIEIGEDLNSKFTEPENIKTVKAIAKSTLKAIEKFVDYEQGIRSGEPKRISKGMRDKAGYWYTNKRLIDMFEITEEEQRHLETIISQEEKYRRRNEANKKARRNENGLTSREQVKADNIAKAKTLIQEGYTQAQAAEIMGMTQQNISYLLNKG